MAMTLQQFSVRLSNMTPLLSKAIVGGMRAGLLLALRSAKTEFITSGSGKPKPDRLTSRSGALRNSIRVIEPKPVEGGWRGGLKAGGARVPYARIHELGGVTRAHIIAARRAPRLAFFWPKTGKWAYPLYVHHPGSKIPARPYLHPALEKALPQVEKQVALAVDVAFRQGLR